MKRTLAGIIIAPLVWPFIEVYIAGVLYVLYTGITIELAWNVGYNNLHRYWWAYGLMLSCGIPLIILCKHYQKTKLWHFALGAGLFALLAPVIYWTGSAVIVQPQDVSWDALYRMVTSGSHLILSGAVTFIIVFIIFWFISVKGNKWYEA